MDYFVSLSDPRVPVPIGYTVVSPFLTPDCTLPNRRVFTHSRSLIHELTFPFTDGFVRFHPRCVTVPPLTIPFP